MGINWGKAAKVAGGFALAILRTQVPGVAAAEAAIVGIKKGGDRAGYVDALVQGAVMAQNLVAPDLIKNDAEFLEGTRLVRDGLVKIRNAAGRVATAGA